MLLQVLEVRKSGSEIELLPQLRTYPGVHRKSL